MCLLPKILPINLVLAFLQYFRCIYTLYQFRFVFLISVYQEEVEGKKKVEKNKIFVKAEIRKKMV